MLDEKHKLEQDVFQIPAPPLRAAPPPPLEPAPAPAPAAAPREMSSDEITGALGDLADLRDRGAISPEEYEAKKQDLLGRL
jgi:putative oligomerization/nucleic acid binding protein